jgi:hypothetical protein
MKHTLTLPNGGVDLRTMSAAIQRGPLLIQ